MTYAGAKGETEKQMKEVRIAYYIILGILTDPESTQ